MILDLVGFVWLDDLIIFVVCWKIWFFEFKSESFESEFFTGVSLGESLGESSSGRVHGKWFLVKPASLKNMRVVYDDYRINFTYFFMPMYVSYSVG
jgi:hypothetical protein